MPHNPQPIEDYHSGDDETIVVTVNDPDGNTVDIRSVTIDYGIFDTSGSQVVTKSVGSGITITDGQNGEFEISIDGADTEDLSGRHSHECQITDTQNNVSTIFTGAFIIEEDLITGQP